MGYNPVVGVWLQRDPVEADENLEAYVNGNPVNKVDPMGLAGQVATDSVQPWNPSPEYDRLHGGVLRFGMEGLLLLGTAPPLAPGEYVVKTTTIGSLGFPYTCSVPGGGLGIWAGMISWVLREKGALGDPKPFANAAEEEIFKQLAANAIQKFAAAVGVPVADLSRSGYAGNIDAMRRLIGRRVDDPDAPQGCKRLQIRTETYLRVSEFIAVPFKEDLYDWEKEAILAVDKTLLDKYPTRDNHPAVPKFSPGLEQWKAIRALEAKHNGKKDFTAEEWDQYKRLVTERNANGLIILLDLGTWKNEGFVKNE